MAAQKTALKTIKIFDTTLRDGEQSPGASMNRGGFIPSSPLPTSI